MENVTLSTPPNARLLDTQAIETHSVAVLFPHNMIAGHYEANRPLAGNAFCPRLGAKGASARLASCSRRLEGL
jgi:hypothetical protein